MRHLPVLLSCALAATALHAGSGYGLGLQDVLDQEGHHAIVPRLDYLHGTDSSTPGGVSAKVTINALTLGVDYNYFFGQEAGKGGYLLVGPGLAGFSLHLAGSSAGTSATTSVRKTTLYPEAGLGWLFTRNVGLEVLYKYLPYHDINMTVNGTPVSYTFNGVVQASLVLRF